MTFDKRLKEMHLGSEDPRAEAALTRALERRPEVAIPRGFSARIVASLPPIPPVRSRSAVRFGQITAYAVALAVVFALLVLTRLYPEALETGHGLLFAIEIVLLAQLLAIGYWLGTRSDA